MIGLYVHSIVDKKERRIVGARQDESADQLLELKGLGYTTVTWNASDAKDDECRRLDRQSWTIDQFLEGLVHNAPKFEKSHVDCNCKLVVSGPGLSDVTLE
jgi:hypothetical protein